MNIYDFQQQFDLEHIRLRPYNPNAFLIYILCRQNKIVYIGKSDYKNVHGRFKAHANEKEFDSFMVIPFDGDEQSVLMVESGLISLVRPEYNKVDCYVDVNKIQYALQCMPRADYNAPASQVIEQQSNLIDAMRSLLDKAQQAIRLLSEERDKYMSYAMKLQQVNAKLRNNENYVVNEDGQLTKRSNDIHIK